jgi:hypothetical protein
MLKIEEFSKFHEKKEPIYDAIPHKNPKKWIIEFAIKSIKVNLLEAADFHKDFG